MEIGDGIVAAVGHSARGGDPGKPAGADGHRRRGCDHVGGFPGQLHQDQVAIDVHLGPNVHPDGRRILDLGYPDQRDRPLLCR